MTNSGRQDDIDRSRDFYCSLLGFKVRWKGKVNAQSGGLKRAVTYGAAGMNHFGFVAPHLDEVQGVGRTG